MSAADQPELPEAPLPGERPSFGRALGAFWVYTLLRFALFGVLWLLLWLVGIGALIAAAIAVLLSVPLSYFLLARPRAAFARTIEARVAFRQSKKADLDARLEGRADAGGGQADR